MHEGLTVPGAVNPAVNDVLTADGRLGRGEHLAALAAFWPHKYAQRRRLLRISEQYFGRSMGKWAGTGPAHRSLRIRRLGFVGRPAFTGVRDKSWHRLPPCPGSHKT